MKGGCSGTAEIVVGGSGTVTIVVEGSGDDGGGGTVDDNMVAAAGGTKKRLPTIWLFELGAGLHQARTRINSLLETTMDRDIQKAAEAA